MLKSATTLLAALTVGWMLFGSPTLASAGEGCDACKPTKEYRHTHHTVVRNVTRNHYKNVEEKVPVRHTTVTVNHVEHIVHVHDVLHVTVHKVPAPYYVNETVNEPTYRETHDFRKVVRYVGCGCGSHHGY